MRCLWNGAATLIDRTGSKAPITTAKPLYDVTSAYANRELANQIAALWRLVNIVTVMRWKSLFALKFSALLFVTLPQRVAKRLQTLQRRYEDTPRLGTPPSLQRRRENERAREDTVASWRKQVQEEQGTRSEFELLIRTNWAKGIRYRDIKGLVGFVRQLWTRQEEREIRYSG